MRKGYTHITLLVDRSGSMADVRADAEGAINAFLEDQKKVDGEATLHVYDFNAPTLRRSRVWNTGVNPWAPQVWFDYTHHEFTEDDWFRQRYAGSLQDALPYKLEPLGGTALLDATQQAIDLTGAFLRSLPEEERPEKVVFIVQTDGEENSSRFHTFTRVRNSIEHQTDKYNWQFVFLGAGPKTFEQGTLLGFGAVTRSSGSNASYAGTYSLLNNTVKDFRTGAAASLAAMDTTIKDDESISTSG